jgi:hypothetical protein
MNLPGSWYANPAPSNKRQTYGLKPAKSIKNSMLQTKH